MLEAVMLNAAAAGNAGPALGVCGARMNWGLSKWPQELSPPCAESSDCTAYKPTS